MADLYDRLLSAEVKANPILATIERLKPFGMHYRASPIAHVVHLEGMAFSSLLRANLYSDLNPYEEQKAGIPLPIPLNSTDDVVGDVIPS